MAESGLRPPTDPEWLGENPRERGFVAEPDQSQVVGRIHGPMVHLLGIAHARLTLECPGLDTKLTGVEPARVVTGLLA